MASRHLSPAAPATDGDGWAAEEDGKPCDAAALSYLLRCRRHCWNRSWCDAGALVGSLVSCGSDATRPFGRSLGDGHVVGGNDGLNTVVPAGDPAYQSARAELAYETSEVLDLGEGLGLNPGMKGLHELWRL